MNFLKRSFIFLKLFKWHFSHRDFAKVGNTKNSNMARVIEDDFLFPKKVFSFDTFFISDDANRNRANLCMHR